MSGLLCAGNVQIALLGDDGSNKGFLGVKNTVSLAIANGDAGEQIRKSKMIDSYGQALDTVYAPGAPTLSLEVDDIDADTIGMSFRGDVVNLSLPAITAQEVTLDVTLGVWFPLAPLGYAVTNVGVKSGDGVTTYVEGTDYKLDADGGMIFIQPTGSIVAGPIKATISAAAVTGKRVNPATKTALRVGVRGRMKNLANGKFLNLVVPDATLYPGEAVDFLSGNFTVNKLSGPIRTVQGQEPVTVDYID